MKKALPRILLCAFEPFDGATINPSWEAVRVLHGKRIAGHRVQARELPTEFDASLRLLKRAIGEVEPTILFGVGQAGGRAQLSLERVAINLRDARIPDNAGAQPVDKPVIANGPAAYFSTLPLKAMLSALYRAGLPAEISHSAGTYVCNQIAYAMLHWSASRRGVRAGFMHIPFLPEQAVLQRGAASMAQADVERGLTVALRTAATTTIDQVYAAGSLD